jgi:hypothetical protein
MCIHTNHAIICTELFMYTRNNFNLCLLNLVQGQPRIFRPKLLLSNKSDKSTFSVHLVEVCLTHVVYIVYCIHKKPEAQLVSEICQFLTTSCFCKSGQFCNKAAISQEPAKLWTKFFACSKLHHMCVTYFNLRA